MAVMPAIVGMAGIITQHGAEREPCATTAAPVTAAATITATAMAAAAGMTAATTAGMGDATAGMTAATTAGMGDATAGMTAAATTAGMGAAAGMAATTTAGMGAAASMATTMLFSGIRQGEVRGQCRARHNQRGHGDRQFTQAHWKLPRLASDRNRMRQSGLEVSPARLRKATITAPTMRREWRDTLHKSRCRASTVSESTHCPLVGIRNPSSLSDLTP